MEAVIRPRAIQPLYVLINHCAISQHPSQQSRSLLLKWLASTLLVERGAAIWSYSPVTSATVHTRVARPAGLLLGRTLSRAGIENVILERRDRAYCEARGGERD